MLRSRKSAQTRAGLVTIVMAALCTVTAFSSVSPAGAAAGNDGSRRYYFGAISLAMDDGASGWSYDYGTRRAALRASYRRCRSHSNYPNSCRKIVWVRNGCAAVATRHWGDGSVRRYGWGVAYTKRRAVEKAVNSCGTGCRLHTWVCTTR